MEHFVSRHDIRKYLTSEMATAHAGLLLRRGMTQYDAAVQKDEGGKGGTEKQKLIGRIAGLGATPLYKAAVKRWQAATADATRFTRFQASLVGRLYIGVARESALETGLTVHHAYGMPLIPGSALKGLARSCARARLAKLAQTWLFGPETDSEEDAERGGVIFHDAWWLPTKNEKPFVEEVVTPHHPEYYNLGKAAATDFDSPIPAPQIAVQGTFWFVLEGDPDWCRLAKDLLQSGLANQGIGGKTRSGYGYFDRFAEGVA